MIDFPRDPRGRELILMVERAKYERWLEQQVNELLGRSFNEVIDLILSPRFRDLTRFQQRRAVQLYRELDRVIGRGYEAVREIHLAEMQGYATLEANIARAQVLSVAGATLRVPLGPSLPQTFLEAIAKLPIQGLTIGEWFEAQATTMSRESKRIIQQGLIEGKAPMAISRRLLADARAEGPVLSRRAVNEARIISRTTVNAVQNDAAMASFERLPPEVSDSYRLLVVRDNRTSTICAALADKTYRYDDPKRQVPPFHVNCRTGVQPIVKDARVTLGEQRTGPMSMRSYGDWLRGQSIGTQNDILGVSRAGLWRDGRMQLADAIDADNRVLTLAQLRARLNAMVGTDARILVGA